MPTPHPPLPPPPQPTRTFFDPFNSSAFGHQRAENRLSGSTSWRDSRTHKLRHQLCDASGRGGTQHLSDLVGAGSQNFRVDGRKENGDWEKDAPGLREEGWRDIRVMLGGERKRSNSFEDVPGKKLKCEDGQLLPTGDGLQYWQGKLSTDKALVSTSKYDPNIKARVPHATPGSSQSATSPTLAPETPSELPPQPTPSPQIFSNLTIYLNGSTAPLISDHKLKQLLSRHGANVSIALCRRTVTHVILGEGGRLAAGKIQKEVARVGGKGVKFVGVNWVLDSIEKGRRQSEGKYQVAHLAMKGQKSMLGAFGKKDGDREVTGAG